ncbi:MAG: hypothetical protein KME25_25125 [Symplocastrum torsivum CPER-KK1]|jgi:GTPase SAR1 family protein|uniref:Uncharacterized protein n=1 Tax=Symplocastrum torsivum CPER-KK1 TaxID=450513 RepID=A0A951UDH2_9CYAN|nr:hypothetical protein [Symplocastrum torsivum CPER-KK1]
MSLATLLLYSDDQIPARQTISDAIDLLRSQSNSLNIIRASQLDTPGGFLRNDTINQIDGADPIILDITRLNFNIIFEFGYALSKGKRVLLVLNRSVQGDIREISEIGLFDSMGYKEYENSKELASLVEDTENIKPLRQPSNKIDKSAPIYVLDTFHKTDASIRIISRIKKSRIRFRSFDPSEQPRLSAYEAIDEIQKSVAVVVNLLSKNSADHIRNNFRGAFLSGLAYGFEKISLLLQEGEEPIPPEYRDIVKVYNQPKDVDKYINSLAPQVMDALQSAASELILKRPQQLIERLDLGAPAAENEMDTLFQYYVDTDESNQTLSGNARLVVGRKGSGKTALFLRIREQTRKIKKNIVLDLKPEGHQLKRLKQLVLDLLQEAVKEHVSTAFWEYLLLLEICHKLLQNDRTLHTRDQKLYSLYGNLAKIYGEDNFDEDVDFSERMYQLVQKISNEFQTKYGEEKVHYLRTNEVTQLIYKHDIPKLRSILSEYLQQKNQVWILFDNIDKGWPTRGVTVTDTTILKALLEATRKLERYFTKKDFEFNTVVFVRNDVFELLVEESSDRGKESKVSLDWTDRDLLKEFLRRRIVNNVFSGDMSFEDAWNQICVTHIKGEATAELLIERSLMRPRNLLTIVNYAKSYAINLRRQRISEEDLLKALATYSADMGNEIGLEVRDVFPDNEDILYYFIDAPRLFSLRELKEYIKHSGIKTEEQQIIEILLWFGFLGVSRKQECENKSIYIYDVFYDMKKLKQLAKGLRDDSITMCINPAFWPFLEI